MHADEHANLHSALRLPGAQLTRQHLLPEDQLLWLLALDDADVALSSADIARFWQQLPYWAFAWAGGRALVRWLRQNPQAVAGKRVLDFGCGSALVGIAAAQAGAAEVWVADLDANALIAAHHNARLNAVTVKPVVAGQWPEVDVLLASDVLYDISSSADLRQLMLTIPQWLLAESRFVKPGFVELDCLASFTTSTLPVIGDFDEQVAVEIYCRAGNSPLL